MTNDNNGKKSKERNWQDAPGECGWSKMKNMEREGIRKRREENGGMVYSWTVCIDRNYILYNLRNSYIWDKIYKKMLLDSYKLYQFWYNIIHCISIKRTSSKNAFTQLISR